ncbi:hypothetical protein ACH429_01595 [Streptomyces pathocidini]|uniref:Uncharacterized protein n=1 Tax=Streptomyces pathocidini TaxID=1650571 RepID=A0ABW7UM60_9ACTN
MATTLPPVGGVSPEDLGRVRLARPAEEFAPLRGPSAEEFAPPRGPSARAVDVGSQTALGLLALILQGVSGPAADRNAGSTGRAGR